MNASRYVRRSWLTICLLFVAASVFAQAQTATEPFEPHVGQPGKDVVWVPTPQALVDTMLGMAKVTPQDFVMDLGSGDGRTVITAAKQGARAMGIEYNPDMVALSKRNAAAEGVTDKATFVNADLFETDLSQATVITMFLLPEINIRLRPKILDLKPGTRIVSNTFTMGDWNSDDTQTAAGCANWCTALLWIVPAKVEGTWRFSQGELTLKQDYQFVSGTLSSPSGSMPVTDGRLHGAEISVSVGDARYQGRVNGDAIEGTVTSGGTNSTWKATRAGK